MSTASPAASPATLVTDAIGAAVGRLPTRAIHSKLSTIEQEQKDRARTLHSLQAKLEQITSQQDFLIQLRQLDAKEADRKQVELDAAEASLSKQIKDCESEIDAHKGLLRLYTDELELRTTMQRRAAHGLLRQQFPDILGIRDPSGVRSPTLTKEGRAAVEVMAALLVGQSVAEGLPTGYARQTTGAPTSEITTRAAKMLEDAWTKAFAKAEALVEQARVSGQS